MIEFELIVRYLSGAASPAEAMLVDDWINENEENRDLFRSIHQSWLEQGDDIYATPDVTAEWETFRKSKIPEARPGKTISLVKIAAAACIFLAIGTGLFWLMNKKVFVTNKEQMVTAGTGVLKLKLPDSSVVLLAEKASLHYSSEFTGSERKVILEGDATFNVSHDKTKPFIIKLERGLNIKVLGTSFSLKQQRDTTWLKVITGSVAFYNVRDTVIVSTGETAFYTATSFSMIPNSRYQKNKTGSFYFNNQPLPAIIKQLALYYQVNIVLSDKALDNCRITAKLDNKTLEEIIPIISATLNVQSQIHEGTIYISGKGCN